MIEERGRERGVVYRKGWGCKGESGQKGRRRGKYHSRLLVILGEEGVWLADDIL